MCHEAENVGRTCLVNSPIHAQFLSAAFLSPSISPGRDTSGDEAGSSRSENILSNTLFVWKLWGAGTRPGFQAAATSVSGTEWALGEFPWKQRREERGTGIYLLSRLPIGPGAFPTSLGDRRSLCINIVFKSSWFRMSRRLLPVLGVSTVITRALKPKASTLWISCSFSCRSVCT